MTAWMSAHKGDRSLVVFCGRGCVVRTFMFVRVIKVVHHIAAVRVGLDSGVRKQIKAASMGVRM